MKKVVLTVILALSAGLSMSAQSPLSRPEHARLLAMAGAWDVEMTLWSRPGANALIAKGTSTIRSILGGLFIEERIDASLNNAPITTMAWTGFNTSTGQYEAKRLSTGTTGRMAEAGTYDDAKKQFELKADYTLAGQLWHQRTVIQATSASAMVATTYLSFGTVPEWRSVEIKYTKRP